MDFLKELFGDKPLTFDQLQEAAKAKRKDIRMAFLIHAQFGDNKNNPYGTRLKVGAEVYKTCHRQVLMQRGT